MSCQAIEKLSRVISGHKEVLVGGPYESRRDGLFDLVQERIVVALYVENSDRF